MSAPVSCRSLSEAQEAIACIDRLIPIAFALFAAHAISAFLSTRFDAC